MTDADDDRKRLDELAQRIAALQATLPPAPTHAEATTSTTAATVRTDDRPVTRDAENAPRPDGPRPDGPQPAVPRRRDSAPRVERRSPSAPVRVGALVRLLVLAGIAGVLVAATVGALAAALVFALQGTSG